ncbi:zinc-finger homeodomain protein 5-like [Curcuma longa]|uniref:zinc-finger homeodomain protein 5-like n=1 Tax=Curcuma longa TaxID=136217 RepID=UPI003D9E8281
MIHNLTYQAISRRGEERERKQELLEEVYNPAPLQQSAFARPLASPSSSSSSFLFARAGDAMGSSLVQKPTPISAAPAAEAMRPEKEPRYRECLRNHAASVGGHVLDGCCEFMPSAGEALKCAACGCHRSFHRKDHGETCELRNGSAPPLLLPPLLPPAATAYAHLRPFGASGVMVRVGSSGNAAAGTESSSEELAAHRPFVVSRKRFRTKFTVEQKEKMLAFAEKVGWRMQRQDEGTLEHFCGEVGVSRHVFKVWMHNNKSSLKKQNNDHQQQQQQQLLEDDEEEDEQQQQQHHHQVHHHRHEMPVD